MNYKPIIMGADSIRAILDKKKTMTRRVVKEQSRLREPQEEYGNMVVTAEYFNQYGSWQEWVPNAKTMGCPYGHIGDRLWVKEAFALWTDSPHCVAYKADEMHYDAIDDVFWKDEVDITSIAVDGKWKSPLYMPRWASRITLEITDIKVERLQDITEEDAKAEGYSRVDEYAWAWDALNAKRGYQWESNPWVWVVSFVLVDERRK